MIDIGDNIFCSQKILLSAEAASSKVTHIARRLILEVYTPEALMKGTMTGQQPRAQGLERMNEEVICLNQQARNAIISKFSQSYFKNHSIYFRYKKKCLTYARMYETFQLIKLIILLNCKDYLKILRDFFVYSVKPKVIENVKNY